MATRPTTTTPLAMMKGGEEMDDDVTRRRFDRSLLCSVEEAAELLSIGKTNTYQLLKTGQLRSVKLGGRRLIPRDALDDFVAELLEAS